MTLTTDFGLDDAYVGVMHGVILGICPEARIVDLCHHIAPQNVRQAAFVLQTAHRYFPPGTVHVVVVDPGVGSARRALAVRTRRAFFVAPDNGVLSYLLEDEPPLEQVHLTQREYWLPAISQTFHGRDIFAPVGAHLAKGVPLAALGQPAEDLVRLPMWRPKTGPDGVIRAQVLHVDHFGNLITNVPGEMLEGRDWVVQVKGHGVQGLSRAYAEVEEGALLALVGSSGHLEIAVRNGSAAALTGAGPDSAVACQHK